MYMLISNFSRNPPLTPRFLLTTGPYPICHFSPRFLRKLLQFQSGFHSTHSTETALVRVTNNLLMTANSGSSSLLILLDQSAAFGWSSHTPQTTSYLTERSENVAMGRPPICCHVVPQGSVLGPIQFTQTQQSHQPLWDSFSLLRWWHTVIHEDRH